MNCCSGYYVHCRQRFFQICRQCLAEPRGAAWLTVANDRYSVRWKSDRPPTENNYAKNLLYSCHPKAAAIAYLIREANEASQQALEGQTDTSSSPRATSLLPTNSLSPRSTTKERRETALDFLGSFLHFFSSGTWCYQLLGFLLA